MGSLMRNLARATLLLVLPLALLVHNTRDGLTVFPGLLDINHYVFNVVLWFWLAGGLLVSAFALRQRSGWPSLCMLLSSACLMVACLDVLVLTTRRESSGPAGEMCISHWNWHRHTVHENSQGFWDDEFPARMEVAVVGDSFTWGQGIPARKHRFTDRVSEKLGIKFWNFGQPGASTRDEARDILPKVAAYKPKVVVVCYLSNDITYDPRLYKPPVPVLSPWRRSLVRASPIYNYLYWRYLALAGGNEAGQRYFAMLRNHYLDPAVRAAHAQEIERMVEQIRAMGAKPVAVILPFPHMFMKVPAAERKAIYSSIAEAFRKGGAPVIELQNLEESFPPGHFEVGPIDSHPSAEVNAAIAEGIAAWFLAHKER